MQDGRYQFKQLFVKMMLPARSLGARGITLDTIKVRYGDGTEEEVSIGQIILTLDKPMEYVTAAGGIVQFRRNLHDPLSCAKGLPSGRL